MNRTTSPVTGKIVIECQVIEQLNISSCDYHTRGTASGSLGQKVPYLALRRQRAGTLLQDVDQRVRHPAIIIHN